MKKKILFIFDMPPEHEVGWFDGLWASLQLLKEDCELTTVNISRSLDSQYKEGFHYGNSRYSKMDDFIIQCGFSFDVVICWSSPTSNLVRLLLLLESKAKLVLCFGGGPINHSLLHKFDLVFVEEDWTLSQMRALGINAQLAFGTNTQIFKPMNLNKRWNVIYPAAFALWKNHKEFTRIVKEAQLLPTLVVGYMQPNDHEKECYQVCIDNSIDVLPHVSSNVLAYLYNMSRKVIVTADIMGGGQRTILEALSCGIEVEQKYLNERLLSVINRGLLTEIDYYNSIKKYIWQTL